MHSWKIQHIICSICFEDPGRSNTLYSCQYTSVVSRSPKTIGSRSSHLQGLQSLSTSYARCRPFPPGRRSGESLRLPSSALVPSPTPSWLQFQAGAAVCAHKARSALFGWCSLEWEETGASPCQTVKPSFHLLPLDAPPTTPETNPRSTCFPPRDGRPRFATT